MKYIFGLLFLVLIALLETSILPFFAISGTQCTLLLIVILALQFLGFPQESYAAAFFGGVLLDLLTSNFFGLSSLILLLLSGAAGLAPRFVGSPPLVLLFLTFLASVLFRVVQVFPIFNAAILLKGGLVDTALMGVLYPTLRYLLKSVFAKKELTVGV